MTYVVDVAWQRPDVVIDQRSGSDRESRGQADQAWRLRAGRWQDVDVHG